jgi:hypothetical protein
VSYSLIRFPAAGLTQVLPVLFVLIMYGLGLGWSWNRLNPRVRYWGIALGILAGLVLGGEVVLEYLLLPANNRRISIDRFIKRAEKSRRWWALYLKKRNSYLNLSFVLLRHGLAKLPN